MCPGAIKTVPDLSPYQELHFAWPTMSTSCAAAPHAVSADVGSAVVATRWFNWRDSKWQKWLFLKVLVNHKIIKYKSFWMGKAMVWNVLNVLAPRILGNLQIGMSPTKDSDWTSCFLSPGCHENHPRFIICLVLRLVQDLECRRSIMLWPEALVHPFTISNDLT